MSLPPGPFPCLYIPAADALEPLQVHAAPRGGPGHRPPRPERRPWAWRDASDPQCFDCLFGMVTSQLTHIADLPGATAGITAYAGQVKAC